MLEIGCEHPYELTKALVWNEGRDISIRCEKCGGRVTVVAYQILIARDLAVWGRTVSQVPVVSSWSRRRERRLGPRGSQGVSASLSLTSLPSSET